MKELKDVFKKHPNLKQAIIGSSQQTVVEIPKPISLINFELLSTVYCLLAYLIFNFTTLLVLPSSVSVRSTSPLPAMLAGIWTLA